MKISAYLVLAAALGLPATQAALAREQSAVAKTAVSQSKQATSWKKGNTYKGNGKKVTDYRSQNLSAPSAGYHWVKDGKTYLLIDTSKGTISSVKNQTR
jgi:Ni/Co efflux regulator RcnB